VTRLRSSVACAAACLAAAGAGCSTDEGSPVERPRAEPAPAPWLERAQCPSGASNCSTASGRILYVERVDPDGDGDAHFVLASREGVTGPGISVIDVRKSMRPSPLPGPGDRVSAAGPVYRGSYGQRQIEAVELHVARVR
jgi:hypothetical protein